MQMHSDPSLLIHPEDAKRLTLEEGGMVRIISSDREVKAKVKLSEKYTEGVLFYPEHLAETEVKDLISYEVDPMTRVPYYHSGPVQIQKEGAE